VNRLGCVRTGVAMNTLVTVEVLRPGAEDAVDRAFVWFHEIERCCTRFDPASELMRLTARAGAPSPASAILFEAVRIALAVAEASGGAFDPTVGHPMESRGFNREHRSGELVCTAIPDDGPVSYRDVQLDPTHQTITLLRPLLLDLGAVAKGLALDAAARELLPFEDFAIDAGGDLYLGGCNSAGAPWSVGIRHPRREHELIAWLQVRDQAVCTSGDYERGEHILDPRTGAPAHLVASATVVAPTAVLADALATAAFVLGPAHGLELLEQTGVQGMIVTPDLRSYETRGLRHAT